MGLKYTEGPFREAEKAQDLELMAPLARILCGAYMNTGQHSKLVDVTSKVMAGLEQTHRELDFFGTTYNVYSGISAISIFSHAMLGNFDKCKALYEKGLYYAQKANSIYALGILEGYYGYSLNFVANEKTAIAHLKQAIEYLEKAQADLGLVFSWAVLGHAYCLCGDPKAGRKCIEKAIKLQTEKDSKFFCL